MNPFGRRRIVIAPFGGEVRPPIIGPMGIRSKLARLSTIRTFLTSVIVVVALANIALAIRTPGIMDTELFVADGSALGCHVPSIPAE